MKSVDIVRASKNSYGDVRHFYHSLIANLNPEHHYVGWKKDIYPSPEFLRSSIESGELFVCLDDGQIVGAMVLNHEYNESYKNYPW